MLDISTLVAWLGALVSCCGAVLSVWFIRRGTDAELKTDLEELALLVDRMAKTQRREKMARVRRSAQETPPAEVHVPVDYSQKPKDQIRARLAQLRGG